MQSLIQDQGGPARKLLQSLRDVAPPLPDPTPTTKVRMGSGRGGAKVCVWRMRA
jgi:hypothetical protein